MTELRSLINIGQVLEEQLIQAEIRTFEQLKAVGSKQAWIKIKDFDPSACFHRLCALEGAIQEIRWHDLDELTKQDLKKFYDDYKKISILEKEC